MFMCTFASLGIVRSPFHEHTGVRPVNKMLMLFLLTKAVSSLSSISLFSKDVRIFLGIFRSQKKGKKIHLPKSF